MHGRKSFAIVFATIAILAGLSGCSHDNKAADRIFVTEYGTGPDKWVTAWLLSRHLFPDAKLKVVETGQPLPEGITFDLPSAEIQRNAHQSAFKTALEIYGVEDPVLHRLAVAIHDIEINYWGAPNSTDASAIDHAFRTLHRKIADDRRFTECYISFFDAVYQAVSKANDSGIPVVLQNPVANCSVTSVRAADKRQAVDELPIQKLLQAIADRKSVAFIDVREPAEYREAHIPGAINLTLRDVRASSVESFKNHDYVVSYCVKDFRGFEMAKLLKRHGVRNAVILNPFGIQGWIAEGLPVIGKNGLQQEQGADWLRQCKADSSRCTAWTAGIGNAPDA